MAAADFLVLAREGSQIPTPDLSALTRPGALGHLGALNPESGAPENEEQLWDPLWVRIRHFSLEPEKLPFQRETGIVFGPSLSLFLPFFRDWSVRQHRPQVGEVRLSSRKPARKRGAGASESHHLTRGGCGWDSCPPAERPPTINLILTFPVSQHPCAQILTNIMTFTE